MNTLGHRSYGVGLIVVATALVLALTVGDASAAVLVTTDTPASTDVVRLESELPAEANDDEIFIEQHTATTVAGKDGPWAGGRLLTVQCDQLVIEIACDELSGTTARASVGAVLHRDDAYLCLDGEAGLNLDGVPIGGPINIMCANCDNPVVEAVCDALPS